MSKARQLADLLDSNGDVVVGALDNAPDPDLTPYATNTSLNTLQSQVDNITTDLVSDTTPQLGGNLDLNGNNVTGTGSVSPSELVVPSSGAAPTTNNATGKFYWNTSTDSLEIYTGNQYKRVYGVLDGSTAAKAAPSAQSLIDDAEITTSGVYWLKAPTMTNPARFYCELSLHGGGWIHLYQRYLPGDHGLIYSNLTTTYNTTNPNFATDTYYGAQDSEGNDITPQEIWNHFIGSGNNAKIYFREKQTTTSYDESQRYVSNSDGAMFSWTNFSRMFYGNIPTGGQYLSGISVYYNNGSSVVNNKILTVWGSASTLVTINNGNVDQELYFCNGGDGADTNWQFALMKGGTPYPRIANDANGGGRHSRPRYGMVGIKA